MHQPNPIRSCCNGTTAIVGNTARSGEKTTSASRFQLLVYRELLVSGMAFTLYGKEPTVTWDQSGKAATLTSGTVPAPLSATSSVWRLKSSNGFYAYDTNDQGPATYVLN